MDFRIVFSVCLAVGYSAIAAFSVAAEGQGVGKTVYDKTCTLCHGPGVAGAPKFGDAGAWAPRLRTGIANLYKSALHGTANGMMPAKGGNSGLSDADVKAAVDYMVAAAGGAPNPAESQTPVKKPAAAAPVAAPPSTKPAIAPAPEPAVPAKAEAPAAAAKVEAPATATPAAARDPNSFNRLLAPAGMRNPPQASDGIHDPANPGTHALQPPLQSFETLPRSNAGNRVNWVAALANKQIQPRWDLVNPAADPMVMDLNIVREVKGSMPDVVYPHKQHTEWLDCSNCHPAIFVPQKGANQISMAGILLGQQCGVCHGKVAFPVSECRLCHSRKKETAPRAAAANAPEAKK